MKFGISLPNFGRDAAGKNILELALSAEEIGFDSVWVSDHIVIPSSHKGFGSTFYEPLVTLSYLASKTTNINLGTSVLILPYRNPIIVAKMISTIDNISNGRVILGIGSGWIKEEFESLESDFKNRGEMTDEYIEIMIKLWTEEHAEYKGKYICLSGLTFNPKPYQRPCPPLWIGGNSEEAMERALLYGDGWHAVGLTPEEIKVRIITITKQLENNVNRSDKFVISVRRNLQITSDKVINLDKSETLRGTAEKIICGLNEYKLFGVDYIIIQILSGSFDEILDTMNIFYNEILKDLN
jgi:probable F420-dependent oxidoreductase